MSLTIEIDERYSAKREGDTWKLYQGGQTVSGVEHASLRDVVAEHEALS